MVNRLLAEVPNKEKQDPLSPEEVRLGAEYLAAAVVICRRLRIQVSDEAGLTDENLICPTKVLPASWPSLKRRAMTDRPLFDAVSRGAISFHHRYHAEYLAAAWIERLMDSNCTLDALEDLLFVYVDGQRVLRPSLAPVASWLIKPGKEPWRQRLAEWLLESAAEIHFVYGDPAALTLDYRRRIFNAVVQRYKGRKRVKLGWDRAAIARLVDEELAEDLNRYLMDVSIAENLRADLLMVVCEGKLLGCVPTALNMIIDPTTSDDLKTYATMVVRDVGNIEHRRQLAQSWAALPAISNTLLGCLCEALFPQSITVAEFLTLLRRSQKVERYSIDLPYILKRLLEQALDASSAKELLRGLLELLALPPLLDKPALSEHFHWLTSLIPVCLRRLLSELDLSSEVYELALAAIHILELVERHGRLCIEKINEEDLKSLQHDIGAHDELRRRLFWKRVERCRQRMGKDPKVFRFVARNELNPFPLSKEDLSWLTSEAASSLPLPDRRLAMEFSAYILRSSGQPFLTSLWRLLRIAGGKPKLLTVAWGWLCEPVINGWLRYIRHKLFDKWWWNRKFHKFNRIRKKFKDRWWLWLHLGGLRKGRYMMSLRFFAQLAEGGDLSQYGGAEWDEATKDWGKTITEAAKHGCIVAWRQFSPQLPHEKEQWNSVNFRVVIGLVALQTLWLEGRLDFETLSADDIDRAVRYACNELNDLPEWFSPLSASRKEETAFTMERAISGEWKLPAELENVHGVVGKMAYTSNPGGTVTKVVMNQLQISEPLHPKMLDYAMRVVFRPGSDCIDKLKSLSENRVKQYTPEQHQWFTWMRTWIHLDALPALDYLERMIASSPTDPDSLVVNLCGAIYGRHEELLQAENPSFLEPSALERLIPLVHRHVRPSEDIRRENIGAYSPGPRDHAQEFRSRLWEGLRNQPSPEADRVLRILLSDPEMVDERDYMLHLLDDRKKLRADQYFWEPEDIRTFAERYSSKPRSDYQMFRLVNSLLRDIKNHIERSENASNRLQVRSGDLEKDFQGFLTGQLSERSLKWFAVTQESEVDLKQRPDIRVAREGLNPIPIEIKLANLKHWTIQKLLEGLENQLVGQYLRPAHVCYGIFVLGNTDPKRHWIVPNNKKKLSFADLVDFLKERATSLQAELQEGVYGLEVIGIDFSDPRER
jgi:hypothetical protein